MILPDYPIESDKADLLKRAPLAKKIASMILEFKNSESFVIGIEGQWGSGKTSFVNLTLGHIANSPDALLIKFNPWNFAGQNELIEDFFDSLSSAIGKTEADNFKVQKVRQYAKKLMRKSEIVFNPEFSYLGFSIKPGEIRFGKKKTLQEEREEVDKILQELKKKIVIVIDDIDRLDKLETRLILKLVKMTANFSNCIFLLAYDREKVAARITEDGWDGEEYLKKIIQVSFSLPEPELQDLWQILFGDLDKSIELVYGKFDLNADDKKRWDNVFNKGFGRLFKTIRDIKRYISSLRLDWSIVEKEDVNVVDFMTIEVIRVFAPEFYTAVAANKSLFTGTFSFYDDLSERIISRNDNKARNEKYQELLNLVPKKIKSQIDGICKELFPPLSGGYNSGDWQEIWRRELRICSEDRFGFYFQLSIPTGAVSEIEMKDLLKTLNNEEDFSKALLSFDKQKRMGKVLEKMLDHLKKMSENKISILINSAWSLEGKISSSRGGLFDLNDTETQLSRLVYHALKAFPKGKRGALLEKSLKKSKNLYFPVKFIAILEDEVRKNQQTREPLLPINDIDNLRKTCVKKIENSVKKGDLDNEENLIFILFRLKEWVSAERVEKYLDNMVSTREGLLNFLSKSVSKVYSTSGDYNNLDKNALSQLYPIEKLEKLVSNILDTDLVKMSPVEQEAVNLFRKPKGFSWDKEDEGEV